MVKDAYENRDLCHCGSIGVWKYQGGIQVEPTGLEPTVLIIEFFSFSK